MLYWLPIIVVVAKAVEALAIVTRLADVEAVVKFTEAKTKVEEAAGACKAQIVVVEVYIS